MNLLKREKWFVNLLLFILTGGAYIFIISKVMNLYKKDSWYTKWQYWVFGTICLFFPVFLFFSVFMVQMYTKLAEALDVPGKDIYANPYAWIICLVIPVIGWILLIVMMIYIFVWINVMFAKGKGEKYIK